VTLLLTGLTIIVDGLFACIFCISLWCYCCLCLCPRPFSWFLLLLLLSHLLSSVHYRCFNYLNFVGLVVIVLVTYSVIIPLIDFTFRVSFYFELLFIFVYIV